MNDLTTQTPSRAGYKTSPTMAEEPVLQVAQRAHLRNALRELNPDSLGNKLADTPSEDHMVIAQAKNSDYLSNWPACGPTRAKSPRFSASVAKYTAENDEGSYLPSLMKSEQHASVRAPRNQKHAEDVFARLSRPRVNHYFVDSDPDYRRNDENRSKEAISSQYHGRTVPQEFRLSVTNSSKFAANKLHRAESESRIGRKSNGKPDISHFDPKVRTEPKPFNLASVELHNIAMARYQARIAQEEAQRAARRRYRALPLRQDMLDGPTFLPLLPPAGTNITVPDECFCTKSDERAARRAAFDDHTRERLQKEEVARAAAIAARERAEEARIQAEWQSHMFHARAMPDFEAIRQRDSLAEKPQGLLPTSPHTPAGLTKTWLRQSSSPSSKSASGIFKSLGQVEFGESSVITGLSNLTLEE